MPSGAVASVINLIRQSYRPFLDVADLLGLLLRTAMSATHAAQGEICLKSREIELAGHTEGFLILEGATCQPSERLPVADCRVCKAIFEDDEKGPLLIDDPTSGLNCARLTRLSTSGLVVPVRYRGAALGLLALTAEPPGHYTASHVEVCQWIASEIAYHLKRYELSDTVKVVFGKDLPLIGTSDALRRVDEFIERASQARLPALILGEFGSEKRYVAHALHFGERRDHPFVEVRCAALEANSMNGLVDQLKRAEGGTIFFEGIDELEYQLQCQLSEVIETKVADWPGGGERSDTIDVRLVASASRDLGEQTEERSFCQPLLEKFDFLLTRIAPLRQRKEDIRPLVEYFLGKHSGEANRSFSSEALNAFETYDWPGNVYELERVVARVAVMSEELVVGLRDIFAYAPKLAARYSTPETTTIPRPGWYDTDEIRRGGQLARIDTRVVRLARNLIKGELSELKRFHPGLRNALEYVTRNLHEMISIHELARHAGLSASHLSYLFQKGLGVNFKSFVAVIRIEEAKQLLVEKPHMRITEISFQVGFGDLSHFERMFKRLVGQPPREYRNLALGPEETQNSS